MRHQDTRIYQTALELNRRCAAVIARFPSGLGYLADETRRAASSVLLNFSEGCGRTEKRERRRFFVMAKASANETMAAIDVAHSQQAVSSEERKTLMDICDHVSAMLHLWR
jgi:four helix bundle protein